MTTRKCVGLKPVFALAETPKVDGTVELDGWDALLARVVLAAAG
ncbi:hypothetical protein [Azospirillum sp. sgz301742]